MLLVSSRLGLFSATLRAQTSKLLSHVKSPLFRSYGRILPSSFTMILSNALVFSTYPPVSVWGTGSSRTRSRRFSRQHRITRIRTTQRWHHSSPLRHTPDRIYLARHPTGLTPHTNTVPGYLPASLRSLPTTRSGHRLNDQGTEAPTTASHA